MFASLKAVNFRGFPELSAEMGPVTVVIGPNGWGKSSLLHLTSLLAQSSEQGRTAAGQSRLDVSRLFASESWLTPNFSAEAELAGLRARRVSLEAELVETVERQHRLKVFMTQAPALSPGAAALPSSLSTVVIEPVGKVVSREFPRTDAEIAELVARHELTGVMRNCWWQLPEGGRERVYRDVRELAGVEILGPAGATGPTEPLRIHFRQRGKTRELVEGNRATLLLLSLLIGLERGTAIGGPTLVVLDEPEMGIMSRRHAELGVRLVRRSRERGAQLLLATHSQEICWKLLGRKDTVILAFFKPESSPRRVDSPRELERALRLVHGARMMETRSARGSAREARFSRLCELVESLFTELELRRLLHVRLGHGGLDVALGVEVGLPFKAFVYGVVAALERRNLIDKRLFDAFLAERPRCAEAIRRVQRQYQRSRTGETV